jgi:hypothetical protein
LRIVREISLFSFCSQFDVTETMNVALGFNERHVTVPEVNSYTCCWKREICSVHCSHDRDMRIILV